MIGTQIARLGIRLHKNKMEMLNAHCSFEWASIASEVKSSGHVCGSHHGSVS
jgi:hypothetical protein